MRADLLIKNGRIVDGTGARSTRPTLLYERAESWASASSGILKREK